MYEALLREDAKLQDRGATMAQIYLGAMAVRYQTDNPEYLVQAAHSLRELMEKMPRFLGIAPVASEGLTVRVREVVTVWGQVEAGGGDGDLRTKLLAKFHERFALFSKWFVERDTPRKEQAGQMLGKMDQRKERLPKAIEKHRIGEWGDYEGYFLGVCHHTAPAIVEEFDSHLAGLEEFVLGYLRPRTFEDRAALRQRAGGSADD
jgi:hypothetical protein